MKDTQHCDVLIIGGGPIGATLALALYASGDSRLNIVVADARPEGVIAVGDRSLALSHASRLVFERIGVWQELNDNPANVTPITHINISQRGHFGSASLRADECGVPALGYVVRYSALQAVLDAALRQQLALRQSKQGRPDQAGVAVHYDSRITRLQLQLQLQPNTTSEACEHIDAFTATEDSPRWRTKLAVAADGSGELMPQFPRIKKDYRQVAVVGRVEVAPDAQTKFRHSAFERFTADGPVALLPFGEGFGLVWTATAERAEQLRTLDDSDFLRQLHDHFGDRVGYFTAIADRKTFPLSLQYAQEIAAQRCVLLGNAAQALHPIAGQGFNLGVRDAWTLATILNDSPCHDSQANDAGSDAQLARYTRSRRIDRAGGIALTHGLTQLFASDLPLIAWPRGLGLSVVDSVAPLKRAITQMMLSGLR